MAPSATENLCSAVETSLSFVSEPEMVDAGKQQRCSQVPYLEYRASGSGDDWIAVVSPSEIDAGRIDLRISAVVRPVLLGGTFVAEIRDTWIPY